MKLEINRLVEENSDLQSTVEEHRQLKEFAESEADVSHLKFIATIKKRF